jgi:Flp pilus assembly protein TadG
MRRRRRVRGGIAILAALVLPLLAGFAALAVDIGRVVVYRTELQSAMDACALAASAQLTGVNDASIFDVARAHALALTDPARAGAAARDPVSVNRMRFQRDTLSPSRIRVAFSSTASGGPWVEASAFSTGGLSPTAARFARCSYADEGNTLFLLPLLGTVVPGLPQQLTVSASATATLAPGQSVCAIPVAVCTVGAGTAANLYGRTVGERLTAVSNPGSGYGSGRYGWLDFTPPAGGASELRDLLNGSGACSVSAGTRVGQPGVVSTLESAWNARFGVYASGMDPASAKPDFTGHGYPTGSNHYADFVARSAARAPFQGAVANNTTKLTGAQHASLGQRRRVAVAAIVDCSTWGASGSAQPPILDFACVLMLAPVRNGGSAAQWSEVAATMDVEFLGLTRTAGTPCASSGLAGGSFGPLVPALVQ